eukprot:31038-Pelagococcus_subviridis.AAC.2
MSATSSSSSSPPPAAPPASWRFPFPPPPTPAATHPSSSPSRCTSFPAYSSIAAARIAHGTFRVTRNCLSRGRCDRACFSSPPCHDHVGH